MRGQTNPVAPWHDARTTTPIREATLSRRAKLLTLDVAILIAWVIGIRLILGEWDWFITGIGIVFLGARMAWDARPRRAPGTGTAR
jgi:hypothetical protein